MVVVVVMVGVVSMMLVVVFVRMAVAVTVAVSMAVAVMRVVKGHDADEVDDQADRADHQQFANPLQIGPFGEALHRFGHDLNANEPVLRHVRWFVNGVFGVNVQGNDECR